MNIRAVILSLAVMGGIPASGQAFEIDPEEMKALRTYCKADVERLCPNVEPGGGRIKACLMANKEQMTVGCAQALQKLKPAKP